MAKLEVFWTDQDSIRFLLPEVYQCVLPKLSDFSGYLPSIHHALT